MPIYVIKPHPVEAVLLDSVKTGLEFLRPGEYSVVGVNAIYVNTDSGTVKARLGEHYLVRSVSEGSPEVHRKEDFEEVYVALNENLITFTAHGDDDGALLIDCSECGPVGTTDDESKLSFIAMQHAAEVHPEVAL